MCRRAVAIQRIVFSLSLSLSLIDSGIVQSANISTRLIFKVLPYRSILANIANDIHCIFTAHTNNLFGFFQFPYAPIHAPVYDPLLFIDCSQF